jgi:hypothetical protein
MMNDLITPQRYNFFNSNQNYIVKILLMTDFHKFMLIYLNNLFNCNTKFYVLKFC